MNNDQPNGIGDWEHTPATVCANPIAVEALVASDISIPVTQKLHLSTEMGVQCFNEENAGGCVDYAIRMCCPDLAEGECSTYGYTFEAYLDSDDPDGQGDLELNTNHGSHAVCDAPAAITARQVDENEVKVLLN